VTLEAGRRHDVKVTVTDEDTAIAWRSGDVAVLATPRIVALCEEAARLAVTDELESGETTVSSRVELSHVSPVPVGATVTAEAVLERVEGRRLVFSVSIIDERGLVGAGKLTRVRVERQRFLDAARPGL
jgi:predicted thioesterase